MALNGLAAILSWRRLLGSRRRASARLAVALGCLAILLWVVDWRVSLALLGRADPALVVLTALLAPTLAIAVSAWKWQRLLAAAAIAAPYSVLFRVYWISGFVSIFLPSVIPGDTVRVAMTRRYGPSASIAGSIVVERITGLAALVLLAAAAVMLRPNLLVHNPISAVLLAAAGGGLIALLLLVPLAATRALSAWQPGEAGWRRRLKAVLLRLGTTLSEVARQPGALLIAGSLTVVFYGLVALSHYTAIRALGLSVSLVDLAAVAPLVILAAALPIVPNGLGIGEGAFVLLYAQIGVPPEAALAAALLRRALVTLVTLAGGAPWLAPANKGHLRALWADRQPLEDTTLSHVPGNLTWPTPSLHQIGPYRP
jgi:glycosyltransferase 2 family protein